MDQATSQPKPTEAELIALRESLTEWPARFRVLSEAFDLFSAQFAKMESSFCRLMEAQDAARLRLCDSK